jgi:hypothetical protein
MNYYIARSTQGLWQVFNSKNELQDSFATKELAENYIEWLKEAGQMEEEYTPACIDEKFLIRTKGTLTMVHCDWSYILPSKYNNLTGKGPTPHEAIERCKAALIAARDELNKLLE